MKKNRQSGPGHLGTAKKIEKNIELISKTATISADTVRKEPDNMHKQKRFFLTFSLFCVSMAAIITSCKTIHQFEVKGSYTFNEKTVYTSGVYLLSENGTHIYIPVCLLHDGNQKLHIASECSGLKFKATPFRRFRWDNPHDIVFSNGKLRSVRMRLVMYIPKSEDFSLQEKDAYRELIQYANFSENVTSRYNTDETNEPLMAHVTFRYDETSNALKPIIDNDNAFSKGWIYYDYSWEKSYLDYKGESFLKGKVSLSETL